MDGLGQDHGLPRVRMSRPEVTGEGYRAVYFDVQWGTVDMERCMRMVVEPDGYFTIDTTKALNEAIGDEGHIQMLCRVAEATLDTWAHEGAR